jgi:hypothetical protein
MSTEPSDPSLVVFSGQRRRGRPRVADPKVSVTTWVPPAYLDRLSKLAIKHDVGVSLVVRRILMKALEKKQP